MHSNQLNGDPHHQGRPSHLENSQFLHRYMLILNLYLATTTSLDIVIRLLYRYPVHKLQAAFCSQQVVHFGNQQSLSISTHYLLDQAQLLMQACLVYYYVVERPTNPMSIRLMSWPLLHNVFANQHRLSWLRMQRGMHTRSRKPNSLRQLDPRSKLIWEGPCSLIKEEYWNLSRPYYMSRTFTHNWAILISSLHCEHVFLAKYGIGYKV